MRVDKWLWAARVFTTRSLATEACHGGKVDVNDEAARPAKNVRGGDLVAITLPHGRRKILRVQALGERRGSVDAARALYEDLTPPEPPRPARPSRPYRPPGAGRPTKRERREIERFLGR